MAMKGVDVVLKEMEHEQKKFRFGAAVALTRTAKRSQEAVKAGIRSSFDRPTPYTVNSTRIRPATKQRLQADVLLKDESFKGTPATRYLWPQVHGGIREPKRIEVLLRARGIISGNEYVVPGKGVRLNTYGNMTRGQVQKILSNMGAQYDAHQNTTNRKMIQYFVARIRGIRGVWQRVGVKGRRIKPILIFVKSPTYRKRLDFYGATEKAFDKYFEAELSNALDYANSTRR